MSTIIDSSSSVSSINSMQRTAILVLGMHRSGTSALTRTLNLLGCALPDNLMPPVANNNETGFWESRSLADFNDHLLTLAGSHWSDWRPLPPGWFQTPVAQAQLAPAQHLLKQSFGDHPLIIFKDPRLCRLLPFWLRVLANANIEPRLLLPLRNPLEVAHSLRRRDGLSLPHASLLWLRYLLDAERDSRVASTVLSNHPRLIIDYQNLLNDWRWQVHTISDHFAFSWPCWSADAELAIDQFLRDGLRHHRFSEQHVEQHPTLADWIKRAYRLMQSLLTDANDATVCQQLDALAATVDTASATFGTVLAAEQAARRTAEHENENAQQRADQAQRDADHAAEQMRLAQQQVAAAQHALSEAQAAAQQAEYARQTAEQAAQHALAEADAQRCARADEAAVAAEQQHQHQQALVEREQITAQREQQVQQLTDQMQSQYREMQSQYRQIAERQRDHQILADAHAEAQRRWHHTEAQLVQWRSLIAPLTAERRHWLAMRTLAQQSRVDSAQRPLSVLSNRVSTLQLGSTPASLSKLPWRSMYSEQERQIAQEQGREMARQAWEPLLARLHGLQTARSWPLLQRVMQWEQRQPRASHWFITGLRMLAWLARGQVRTARQVRAERVLTLRTGLFDSGWYARRYPQVLASGQVPVVHWLAGGWQAGYWPNPLFDVAWYGAQLAEGLGGLNPLCHYHTIGAAAGLDPHPLFATRWYQAQCPEQTWQDQSPLAHWLHGGGAAGVSPHPLFASRWYLERYPDVAQAGANPLLHYLEQGAAQGYDPNPLLAGAWYWAQIPVAARLAETPLLDVRLRPAATAVSPHPLIDWAWFEQQSGSGAVLTTPAALLVELLTSADPIHQVHPLFASDWYGQHYPDVAAAGQQPLLHFVTWGAAEGRQGHPLWDRAWQQRRYQVPPTVAEPLWWCFVAWGAALGWEANPLFASEWYWQQYPDVAQAGLVPIVHYVLAGQAEDRAPHPLFDVAWYLRQVPQARGQALQHYLEHGAAAGVSPQPLFDPQWYQAQVADGEGQAVALSLAQTALGHYLEFGAAAGLNPHPLVDGAWYRQQVAEPVVEVLGHYLEHGAAAGVSPLPLFDAEWYQQQVAEEVGKSGQEPVVAGTASVPLQHYVCWGAAAGLSPHPLIAVDWALARAPAGVTAATLLVRALTAPASWSLHPLFDATWAGYEADTWTAAAALRHYVLFGGFEGRDPHPVFASTWYLDQDPALLLQGMNPLVHYVRWGGFEGRDPHPLFDSDWYLDQDSALVEAGMNPLVHYVRWGGFEGRDPHPLVAGDWIDQQVKRRGLRSEGHAVPGADPGAAPEVTPLVAYLVTGAWQECDPHPLFANAAYLAADPALAEAGMNPLVHYLCWGGFEGRWPHPLFDSAGYLRVDPALREAGLNPLLHYVRWGGFEGRDPHPLFTSSWYLEQDPALREAGLNPLVHYVCWGAAEGRWPNPWFDSQAYRARYLAQAPVTVNPLVHYLEQAPAGLVTSARFDGAWYWAQYPDVAAAGIDPLVHFITQGQQEGRAPQAAALVHSVAAAETSVWGQWYQQWLAQAGLRGSVTEAAPASGELVADDGGFVDAAAIPVRVLAFYLPQFHPIPENDRWWGTGFTEWTNVAKAVPQFVGHDQPRQPGDLGFYDLRLASVMAQQIELARRTGLSGFCCHYYWFGGRRLLETPVLTWLAHPEWDFGLCLCWANENWTRRWDGGDETVLIGQHHTLDTDTAFLADVAPILRDPRYVRVAGAALVVVYRPGLLADARATTQAWRAQAEALGIGPLYLAAVQAFEQMDDPAALGFDALVEFPPHGVCQVPWSESVTWLNPAFQGRLLRYEACVEEAEERVASDEKHEATGSVIHPGVMTAWDNTARRLGEATIFAGASPALYQRWLQAALTRAWRSAPKPDQRLVFVNAWNEWAEGAYLEPDRRFGHAWLRATRAALRQCQRQVAAAEGLPVAPAGRVLVVGHDGHRHGAQLLTLHIVRTLREQFGLTVRLWLLEGGALLSAYEQVAESVQVWPVGTDPSQWRSAALALRMSGTVRWALTNTVVTGPVVPALQAAGLTVVSLIHELPMLIRERQWQDAAQALSDHADWVVFAAQAVQRGWAEVAVLAPERARIIPQGVYQSLVTAPDQGAQVRARLGIAVGVPVVLVVGYADRRKGFDWFLELMAWFDGQGVVVEAVWLGDWDDQSRALWQCSVDDGVPWRDRVHAVGFTDAVAGYYAAADVLVLPSREDPFPSVVLEALWLGVPVVAFAESGGVGEMIDQPRDGRLVVPLGDVAALGQGVLATLADVQIMPEGRAQRMQAARSRFDWARYVWQLLALGWPGTLAVSVIVPNYNYGRYLAGRLASVWGQGYPLYEVIVLDDASTDDSMAVVEQMQARWQRRVQWVPGSVNSGSVFAQWARGVALARGELVWIAEADDEAEGTLLARLAGALAVQEDVALAFCDSVSVDAAGTVLAESYAPYCADAGGLSFTEDFVVSGAVFVREALAVKNTVLNVSAVLWRRLALVAGMQALGWLSWEGDVDAAAAGQWRIAGDWRLLVAVALDGGAVRYVAEPLNRHRRHGESVGGGRGLEDHVAEITRMHEVIVAALGADETLLARQAAYRQTVGCA
jgi:glycosyltransferase involved in cell wall biosynthesis